MNPGKHQSSNKEAKMEGGRSTTVPIFCFYSYAIHELRNRDVFIG